MSAARGAVARALYGRRRARLALRRTWDALSDDERNGWKSDADVALAALRPFIAAEIRAWANGEFEAYDRAEMDRFDVIASRICGAGE